MAPMAYSSTEEQQLCLYQYKSWQCCPRQQWSHHPCRLWGQCSRTSAGSRFSHSSLGTAGSTQAWETTDHPELRGQGASEIKTGDSPEGDHLVNTRTPVWPVQSWRFQGCCLPRAVSDCPPAVPVSVGVEGCKRSPLPGLLLQGSRAAPRHIPISS